jgi:hypothetical protein
MGYPTLKESFKSDQYFLRLARSNKQTLQLYNISTDMYDLCMYIRYLVHTYIRSTARLAIQLQFDFSANTLAIRAVQGPKCIV